MIRVLAVLAVAATLLTGCGSDSGGPSSDSKQAARVAEVGKDLKAGVYTSKEKYCIGFTATTRDFSLDAETSRGEMIAGAVQVRDRNRIELHDGDFFHAVNCTSNAWKREERSSPESVDPATVEGACGLLMGDGLLADALEYPKVDESEKDRIRRSEIQERLMSIVFADIENDMPLASSAGQIVDFLDDPEAYVEDGKLSPVVTAEVAEIKKTCA